MRIVLAIATLVLAQGCAVRQLAVDRIADAVASTGAAYAEQHAEFVRVIEGLLGG